MLPTANDLGSLSSWAAVALVVRALIRAAPVIEEAEAWGEQDQTEFTWKTLDYLCRCCERGAIEMENVRTLNDALIGDYVMSTKDDWTETAASMVVTAIRCVLHSFIYETDRCENLRNSLTYSSKAVGGIDEFTQSVCADFQELVDAQQKSSNAHPTQYAPRSMVPLWRGSPPEHLKAAFDCFDENLQHVQGSHAATPSTRHLQVLFIHGTGVHGQLSEKRANAIRFGDHVAFDAPLTRRALMLSRGDQWWQRNGVRKTLQSRLSEEVSFHAFIWPGSNSEEIRLDAADGLSDLLKDWEERHFQYGLVSHSHGGNVVKYALAKCARRGVTLEGLRSVSSVGTPFFDIQESSLHRVLLLIPICLGVLMLWLLRRVMEHGSAVVVMIAVAGVAVAIYKNVLAKHADQVMGIPVMWPLKEPYWQILCSRSDEALGALRLSRKVRMRIVPRLRLAWRGIGFSALFYYVLRRVLLVVPAIFLNHIVAPVLDRLFANLITRRLQGNDLMGMVVTGVYYGPDGTNRLPEDVDLQIQRLVDNERIDLSGMRDAMMKAVLLDSDLVAATGHMVHRSQWNSCLVHTSYFREPRVIELLASHLKTSNKEA